MFANFEETEEVDFLKKGLQSKLISDRHNSNCILGMDVHLDESANVRNRLFFLELCCINFFTSSNKLFKNSKSARASLGGQSHRKKASMTKVVHDAIHNNSSCI